MSRIDHIGIATEDIEQASKFWKLIGMKPGDDEINLEQDVKIRMFYGNNENGENTHSKVELIEALSENSPIAKFISKRGEGIQQLAITVVDLDELIINLIEK
jgi:methylmalonyl-CoA/ethylmalonyl-CoA epimerase